MIQLTERLLRVLVTAYLLIQPIIGFAAAQEHNSDLILTNLILEGNETRAIRDTTLNIEGVIELKENATLLLENVKVRFVESELYNGFNVKDNALLTLVNSDITYTINLNQYAHLNASNTKLYSSFYCTTHGYNHTTGGILAHHSSEIMLDNCKVGYLWLHDDSSAVVNDSFIYYSFPEEAKLLIKDSTIQSHRENIKDEELDIIIPNFDNYSGRLDSLFPSAKSFFDNVTLFDGIWLRTINSNIKISDSYLYLIHSEKNCEIHLNNVTLTQVSSQLFDSGSFSLFAEGCKISNIVSFGSNDTICIEDSRIERVSLGSYKLSLDVSNSMIDVFEMDDVWFKPLEARISHSTIGFFSPGLGNEVSNEYYLHNVTLRDGLGFKVGAWGSTGGIDLHGIIHFGDGFSVNDTVVDGFAIVNRYYPVFVNSTSGPLANVSLVTSVGNRTLWTGETSRDGVVEVPVRYVNIFNLVRPYNVSGPSVIIINNITEVVTLSWSNRDVLGSIDLDLFTETPIVIEIVDESSNSNLIVLGLIPIIVCLIIFYNRK